MVGERAESDFMMDNFKEEARRVAGILRFPSRDKNPNYIYLFLTFIEGDKPNLFEIGCRGQERDGYGGKRGNGKTSLFSWQLPICPGQINEIGFHSGRSERSLEVNLGPRYSVMRCK